MKVTGTLNIKVQYVDQFKKLVLVVTAGNGPSIQGQNWLIHINLNWKKLFAVRTARLRSLHTLMERHKQLFAEGVGTVCGKGGYFMISLSLLGCILPRSGVQVQGFCRNLG